MEEQKIATVTAENSESQSPIVSRLDPLAVANWFLVRAIQEGREYTQLQINKLVYFAHGWHLGAYSVPFIADRIVAWKHGPVVPTLREEFRHYGSRPITSLGARFIDWDQEDIPQLTADALENGMLEWVYESYGRMTAAELVATTHQPGSPWADITNRGKDIGYDKVIPDPVIENYYRGLLEKMQGDISAESK